MLTILPSVLPVLENNIRRGPRAKNAVNAHTLRSDEGIGRKKRLLFLPIRHSGPS
jgi:hypothetical protein